MQSSELLFVLGEATNIRSASATVFVVILHFPLSNRTCLPFRSFNQARIAAANAFAYGAPADVTGPNKSSGSERESLSKGAGHADEEVQTGADRDVAAAN
jgi:hypothetical protein